MLRPCLGCGRPSRTSRCPACTPRKAPTAARGYDAAWRRVREGVLERDGWTCRYCGGAANTVDHVTPLAHGGARLDPGNLVAACLSCNSSRGATTRRSSD